MLYFLPQMQTKIANEGWAVFHATPDARLDLSPQEYVDFANMHSGVLQPARRRINPYHVGHGILEDINRRHGGDETTVAPIMFEMRERPATSRWCATI